MNLSNNGLYWNARDLRNLWNWYKSGLPITRIANLLDRTPSACDARLRMLKINNLWKYGRDDETLQTYQRRKEAIYERFQNL
jgi:hypothetical protein